MEIFRATNSLKIVYTYFGPCLSCRSALIRHPATLKGKYMDSGSTHRRNDGLSSTVYYETINISVHCETA